MANAESALKPLSLEELMEAGVHFGHKTSRWNPRMKRFLWGKRNGIHIIDLTQTIRLLEKSAKYLKDQASRGKKIVFVGTKKQASGIIAEEADRVGAYYINRRWLGGTLTNFDIIRTRIKRLCDLQDMRDNGHFERLPKKEVAMLNRQLDKLEKSLGGLRNMRGMPDVLVVVDVAREKIAVEEAQKAGIPVVGLVDSNCDPSDLNYVIPGNDDALRSIRFVMGYLGDAIEAGKKEREQSLSGAAVLKDEMAKGKQEKTTRGVQKLTDDTPVEEDTTEAEAPENEAKAEEKEMVAAGAADSKE